MDITKLFNYFRGAAPRKEIEQIDDELGNGGDDAFLEYQRARFLFEGMTMYDAPKSHPGRRKARLRWMGYFAAAAVAAAVAVPLTLALQKESPSSPAAVSTLMLETLPGQTACLTLADGSRVKLNSGSYLEYPSDFASQQRRVRLSGEAFFDVAKDDSHPFVVSTYAADVTVHGTAFNVEAREQAQLFSTTLVRGSVSVSKASDPSYVVTMLPDDVVTLEGTSLVRSRLQDKAALCWVKGQVNLRCANFDLLMQRLENVFGVRISVSGDRPSTDRLSGEIATSHGADYALQVLSKALNFSYRLEPDGTYAINCR